MSDPKCEYCDGTGEIEMDNNGPIGKCPICNEGNLTPRQYDEVIRVNGKRTVVSDLECYVCDKCGADPVFDDQIKRDHEKYLEAKKG